MRGFRVVIGIYRFRVWKESFFGRILKEKEIRELGFLFGSKECFGIYV